MNEPCFYRVSVKGIVIDETGRFLLAREDNDMWELIGGGLDHGEDPLAALRREIHEETGLEVTYISEQPSYFITARMLGRDKFVANAIYEMKLKDLDFTPSSECQELRFFSVEEAKRADLFPNAKQFVRVFDVGRHNK